MNSVDPPIPPGATKFSYSARMAQFRLRLCDTDMEFLELKVLKKIISSLIILLFTNKISNFHML